jgi:hypothetical protein
MPDDLNTQFLKGLEAIQEAIELECRVQHISQPMIRHDGEGSPHSVVFSLQVNGREVELRFPSEEIRDSAGGHNPRIRGLLRALVTVARSANTRI